MPSTPDVSSPTLPCVLIHLRPPFAELIPVCSAPLASLRIDWKSTNYLKEVDREKPTVYYDSVTGKPLFVAPIGRTMSEFLAESDTHGWPSFRDQEVVWENMRVLKSTGESVSADGTHLGHNLPDGKGNRYCINLVSIAGRPLSEKREL
jgi:peptide methionine sulfoxide reductase MsrB